MKSSTLIRAISGPVFLIILLSSLVALPSSRSAIKVESKNGGCVILPYDFAASEAAFPDLDIPDNALLTLAMEKGKFEPEKLAVLQGGRTYRPAGVLGYYQWGAFYIVYFDPSFTKYGAYEARLDDGRALVSMEKIASLKGAAKPTGRKPWRDPVTEASIRNTPPIELADLLARGRSLEYADQALGLRAEGGLPFVRTAAIAALDKKDYPRAAVLFGEAIKWSEALELPDIRRLANFQDWVSMARAFMGMGAPLAAVRAYDEAIKILKDPAIVKERQAAWETYKKSAGSTETGPYALSLSEAELEFEPHGKIPIPADERGVIREGVSAGGVYLGDHKERIRAQCGEPAETFSGMMLYFDHPLCPEAMFFTSMGRAYALRSTRGKTTKGVGMGDGLAKAAQVYGKPDRRETTPIGPNRKPSVKWVYLKQKTAFVDLNGNGLIDAVEIFDYSLNR